MKNQEKAKEQLIAELEKLQNHEVTEKRLIGTFRGITEREKAAEVTQSLKDFYKIIVDEIRSGVWVTDKDDVIYYVNKGMEIIAGIPKDKMTGARVLKDFPEQTLRYFSPKYLKAKKTLKSIHYGAIPVTTPAGRPSYQSGWLIPRTKENLFDGMICTVEDVTDQKQLEAELRMHRYILEEMLEERTAEKDKLIDNLKKRIKELDCLYHLTEYRTLPDISLEELLNKTVSILPQAWQYPQAACARIVFRTKSFETKNFAETKWLQSADIKIDKDIVGVVEVGYLQEKPELDEGPFLNEERKLINTIAERLAKIIQHDELERYQRLSTQILELLNRPFEMDSLIKDILLVIKQFANFEAVGIRLREGEDFPYYEVSGFPSGFIEDERCLCAKNDRGELIRDSEGNAVLECMCGSVICGRTDPSRCFFSQGGSFWTNSTTQLLATTTDKDRGTYTRNRCNTQGYESVALIPLRAGQENIGLLQLNDSRKNMFGFEMIHNFEKISASIGIAMQRKNAVDDLERARRQVETRASALEIVNSELAQYGYVVSHDLRAPLRAIRNYTEFLHEDLAESLTGEQKDYLDGMLNACGEANTLVEDLLSFSQIDRREGYDESIDVGKIIRDILKTLKLSNEIEIVKENKWPVIKTSRVLLQQIFQNLIVNAVKFNVSRPKRVELGFKPVAGNAYEFFVRDNGIGIDPRYHEKIFHVFERLHTSKEYEGTGIGLAIVRKAAVKLQGSVRVESDPGKGSTFFVTIPFGNEKEIDD